jgi:L-ascorbate metabolism protein UlaG (beta-lactamase superfamily)
MEILYIGHAGILVKENDIIIAIDPFLSDQFFWNGHEEKYLGASPWMGKGKNDFIDKYADKLNVILITHAHGDHFDYKSIVEILNRNPDIQLISPFPVTEWLKYSDAINPIIKNFLIPCNWDEDYEIETENTQLIVSVVPNKGMKKNQLPSRVGFSISNDSGISLFHTGDSHGVGEWGNIKNKITDIIIWAASQRKEMVEYFYESGALKRVWWIHFEEFEPGKFSCNRNPRELINEFTWDRLEQSTLDYNNWIKLN